MRFGRFAASEISLLPIVLCFVVMRSAPRAAAGLATTSDTRPCVTVALVVRSDKPANAGGTMAWACAVTGGGAIGSAGGVGSVG